MLAKATQCRSYGDPVLERRRPGGTVLAITGQGSQADLSLSPSCEGVSNYKQNNKAHIKAWVSVRTKTMVGESARVEETITGPELAKDHPATECFDG